MSQEGSKRKATSTLTGYATPAKVEKAETPVTPIKDVESGRRLLEENCTLRGFIITPVKMSTTSTGKPQLKLYFRDASGIITLNAWEPHADKFLNKLEFMQAYQIERVIPKALSENYTKYTSHQITLSSVSAKFTPISADDKISLMMGFPFEAISIESFNSLGLNSRGDLVVRVKEVKEERQAGAHLITEVIVEDTTDEAKLVLWDQEAAAYDLKAKEVIKIYGGCLSEFSGEYQVGLAFTGFITRLSQDDPFAKTQVGQHLLGVEQVDDED